MCSGFILWQSINKSWVNSQFCFRWEYYLALDLSLCVCFSCITYLSVSNHWWRLRFWFNHQKIHCRWIVRNLSFLIFHVKPKFKFWNLVFLYFGSFFIWSPKLFVFFFLVIKPHLTFPFWLRNQLTSLDLHSFEYGKFVSFLLFSKSQSISYIFWWTKRND